MFSNKDHDLKRTRGPVHNEDADPIVDDDSFACAANPCEEIPTEHADAATAGRPNDILKQHAAPLNEERVDTIQEPVGEEYVHYDDDDDMYEDEEDAENIPVIIEARMPISNGNEDESLVTNPSVSLADLLLSTINNLLNRANERFVAEHGRLVHPENQQTSLESNTSSPAVSNDNSAFAASSSGADVEDASIQNDSFSQQHPSNDTVIQTWTRRYQNAPTHEWDERVRSVVSGLGRLELGRVSLRLRAFQPVHIRNPSPNTPFHVVHYLFFGDSGGIVFIPLLVGERGVVVACEHEFDVQLLVLACYWQTLGLHVDHDYWKTSPGSLNASNIFNNAYHQAFATQLDTMPISQPAWMPFEYDTIRQYLAFISWLHEPSLVKSAISWQGEPCPVCLEEMASPQSALTTCAYGCGRSFHNQCIYEYTRTTLHLDGAVDQNLFTRAAAFVRCPLCTTSLDLPAEKRLHALQKHDPSHWTDHGPSADALEEHVKRLRQQFNTTSNIFADSRWFDYIIGMEPTLSNTNAASFFIFR